MIFAERKETYTLFSRYISQTFFIRRLLYIDNFAFCDKILLCQEQKKEQINTLIGVITNCIAVIIGSITGMLFSNHIPKKLTDAIMTGIGLCTLYIGISGALKGQNTLVLIFSIALGAVIGTLIDIDGKITRLGEFITKKFKGESKGANPAEGFVTASLLFCVGSMTFVGSIQAGVQGDNTLLFTKSVLDLISAIALAATFGFGVTLSSAFVLVFQGGLVLLSYFAAPYMTAEIQNEMICAGSVLIIGIGMNILGITKIKVANYIPAMFVAPFLTPLLNMLV